MAVVAAASVVAVVVADVRAVERLVTETVESGSELMIGSSQQAQVGILGSVVGRHG